MHGRKYAWRDCAHAVTQNANGWPDPVIVICFVRCSGLLHVRHSVYFSVAYDGQMLCIGQFGNMLTHEDPHGESHVLALECGRNASAGQNYS